MKRLEGAALPPAPVVFTITRVIVEGDGDGEVREVHREVRTVEMPR